MYLLNRQDESSDIHLKEIQFSSIFKNNLHSKNIQAYVNLFPG